MRGACSAVATSAWTLPAFRRNFPQAAELFLPYSDDVRSSKHLAPVLANYAAIFDVTIATFFMTVRPVSELVGCHPRVRPAYFVQASHAPSRGVKTAADPWAPRSRPLAQDYEPDFDMPADLKKEAYQSYTRVKDMLLFAKTSWLQQKVGRLHNVTVHHVQASVNLSAFAKHSSTEIAAAELAPAGPVCVVAMIRPSTPRRNPEGQKQPPPAHRAALSPPCAARCCCSQVR